MQKFAKGKIIQADIPKPTGHALLCHVRECHRHYDEWILLKEESNEIEEKRQRWP